MSFEDISVAAAEAVEALVDDAPAAEDYSAEEIASEMNDGESVENNADDAQPEENPARGRQEDKRSRQMKAAIASAQKTERKRIFEGLGMTENEVRELVRNAKAEKMAKDDPEISVKAARKIVEAEERSGVDSAQMTDFKTGFKDLADDGYSADELRSFASDEDFIAAIQDGKTFRQAARLASRKSGNAAQSAQRKKSAVPTSRVSTSSDEDIASEGDYIASMSPERFRAFREEAHKRAMRGQAVRM